VRCVWFDYYCFYYNNHYLWTTTTTRAMPTVRGITTYDVSYIHNNIYKWTYLGDIFYYLPVNVYYRIASIIGTHIIIIPIYMYYTFLASVRPKGVLKTQCSLVQYNLYTYIRYYIAVCCLLWTRCRSAQSVRARVRSVFFFRCLDFKLYTTSVC